MQTGQEHPHGGGGGGGGRHGGQGTQGWQGLETDEQVSFWLKL